MYDVVVAGVGMTRFAKRLDTGLKQLAAEAVEPCLADAGVRPDQIEYAVVANSAGATIGGQGSILGQVGLRPLGIAGIPIVNVENACAGASTAFHLAWQAVASGSCDIALALGVEKLTHPDKGRTLRAFAGGVDADDQDAISADAVPGGAGSGKPRSMFMDIYAELIRDHMARYGSTPEQFAKVVVKNHRFGARNSLAQYGSDLTVEEVLAAPVVSAPLTLYMCAPIGDGAAAAVLMSPTAARQAGMADRPAVRASILGSSGPVGAGSPGAEERAAQAAFDQAGLGPDEVDVAEVHDATAPAELFAYEKLGFCAPGDGGRLIDERATDLGGMLPVNTSGGLVARGHPVGATGLAQIAELAWQLRGRCGDRQVEGARVALAQNAGGFLGGESAVQCVTILSV